VLATPVYESQSRGGWVPAAPLSRPHVIPLVLNGEREHERSNLLGWWERLLERFSTRRRLFHSAFGFESNDIYPVITLEAVFAEAISSGGGTTPPVRVLTRRRLLYSAYRGFLSSLRTSAMTLGDEEITSLGS
jgi:hypothetical protein